MKKIVTLGLLTIFIMLIPAVADESVNILYDNKVLDDETKITIDGDYKDWADVDEVNITLKPARDTGSGSHDMQFKATRDANKLYLLIVVKDNYYFYNYDTGISHRNSPALGVAFPIDDGAKAQYMGGSDEGTDDELNKTTGLVDIMHWELDVEAGVKTGGSKDNADKYGDGVANLDDEYSTTPWDRHDDNDAKSNNLWEGAWSHTSDMKANGTAGYFIFELSRDLVSSDKYDATFAEGDTTEVTVAYWSPNETSENKWTDDGHYTNSEEVIEMTFSSDVVGAPGFGLYIALLGVFALIPILRRRK